jgi:N4-gp56 family major capsid protein
VDTLKVNKAKRITRMIDPTTGISTYPVNACYIAFVHPDTTKALKNINATTAGTFIPIQQYADPSKALPDEVGSIDEIRCIESSNCQIFTGAGSAGINVYATIVLGANAYGISRISGEALKNIIKPLGTAGSADPLDQRATSGWKATFVAVRLNETFMVRWEHAVS